MDFGRNFFLTDDKLTVAKLSKLPSTTSREHFDKKTFWKNLPRFFRTVSKFLLTIGTNFSVKLSKLLSPCLDEHFDGKHFFGKFTFILSSDFQQNIFWTWLKISHRSSQKRNLRVQKTFWGNWLFGDFFDPIFTETMSESVSEFDNLLTNLPKLHSKNSDKHFGEFFRKNSFLSVFGTIFFSSSAEFKQKGCQN